ncbi:ORF6N domain-containing protein [bacterium A37T11]|nr:ORF6N domain-containing protein [bacterium A37T11]
MAKTATNQEILVPDEVVMNQIYIIRGQKVMLDKDLAILYGVVTGNLNKAVKRNIKRFPDDNFMFQLTDEEFKNLIFQIGTSSWGGTRKPPFAFGEMGVAMLSGILNSDRAISVNIQILRIFTRMRQLLTDTTDIRLQIEQVKNAVEKQNRRHDSHDKNIELIFQYLDRLQETAEKPKPETKGIGFDIGKGNK